MMTRQAAAAATAHPGANLPSVAVPACVPEHAHNGDFLGFKTGWQSLLTPGAGHAGDGRSATSFIETPYTGQMVPPVHTLMPIAHSEAALRRDTARPWLWHRMADAVKVEQDKSASEPANKVTAVALSLPASHSNSANAATQPAKVADTPDTTKVLGLKPEPLPLDTRMDPPPEETYPSFEAAIEACEEHAIRHGYSFVRRGGDGRTTKRLNCYLAGQPRGSSSKLVNCPMAVNIRKVPQTDAAAGTAPRFKVSIINPTHHSHAMDPNCMTAPRTGVGLTASEVEFVKKHADFSSGRTNVGWLQDEINKQRDSQNPPRHRLTDKITIASCLRGLKRKARAAAGPTDVIKSRKDCKTSTAPVAKREPAPAAAPASSSNQSLQATRPSLVGPAAAPAARRLVIRTRSQQRQQSEAGDSITIKEKEPPHQASSSSRPQHASSSSTVATTSANVSFPPAPIASATVARSQPLNGRAPLAAPALALQRHNGPPPLFAPALALQRAISQANIPAIPTASARALQDRGFHRLRNLAGEWI